jgi:hypothetical protein
VTLLALALVSPVAAQDATPDAAGPGGLRAATAWLLSQQLDTGAFPGFSGEADPGTTVDAIIALVSAEAAGVETADAVEGALAYLGGDGVASGYAGTGVGQAAKLALALVAAGADSSAIDGIDPLALVSGGQDPETGFFGVGVYDHAYAMLALAATGTGIPDSAFDTLADSQASNGGWAFDGATDPAMADSNTTSMVVQALVAAGHADEPMVDEALAFLASTVTGEGAAYVPGADPDANSTALVLQAMLAAGEPVEALAASLLAFQTGDGAFFYQEADPTANLFSTVQAMPAAAGVTFPVVPDATATPAA